MSAVSSLRTFLSLRRVSACVLRSLAISSCCSFEKRKRSLPLFCFWRAERRCCVCSSSFSNFSCSACHFLRASASRASTFVNGRLEGPRERTPMSSSRPAYCSITLEKSSRLSFMGCAMAPKIVFITRTQNSSARKSESAKSTTLPLPSAVTLGTALVDPSTKSGPLGKAVLNVPERRAARVRCTPSGLRSRRIAPMPNCAPERSTRQASVLDEKMSGSKEMPSFFAKEKDPENGSSTWLRRETRMSLPSTFFLSSERNAGLSSARPVPSLSLVAAERSATSLDVSNVTPHASKSLPSVEGPSWPPICCIIGFCCWRLEIMSMIENGSTHAMRRPPRRTNWSIAKSVFSERSFACSTTSVFTSSSILSASTAISRTS